MAMVADKARAIATISPDGSVKYGSSDVDPHICTMNTGGDTLVSGTFPVDDDRGNPDTGIDWTKAGTDLARP